MKDQGWQPQIIIILLNTRYTQHGFNSIFNTGMGMQLKNKVVFSELSFCSEASSYSYSKSTEFWHSAFEALQKRILPSSTNWYQVIFPALSASSKREVRPSAHNKNKWIPLLCTSG